MKVKFRVNLGSQDAEFIASSLGMTLDHNTCLIGREADVSTEVAEWLCDPKRGIAERPSERIKTIAKDPTITAPAK